MRPTDPRIRQTLNQITQNLESANETAQEGIYAFSHNYISPCLASIRGCVESCTVPCFPNRDDPLRRRKRGRSRGRPEQAFDFYDDWDYTDEVRGDNSLLGWSHDELDRLLAGSSAGRTSGDQPRRNRRMSYGARRKALPNDERQDPTVIPSSSILGFLERFPWRIGAKGIRYRPSGADLQENPGGAKRDAPEAEPLLEGSDESDAHTPRLGPHDDAQVTSPGGRQRSGTQSSGETRDSLSSRGDLWPSDEEEDAVPLDDEFAMAPRFQLTEDDSGSPYRVLTRNPSGDSALDTAAQELTGTTSKGKGKRKGSGVGKGKGKGRKNSSRKASKTTQSPASEREGIEPIDVPTLEDLKAEEERVRIEEEKEIEQRRQAALQLARSRGLSADDGASREPVDPISPPPEVDDTTIIPPAVPESLSDDPANYPIPPSPDLEATDTEPPAHED